MVEQDYKALEKLELSEYELNIGYWKAKLERKNKEKAS